MGDTIKMLHGDLQSGDCVVGSYNGSGKLIKNGGVMLDDTAREFRKDLIRSMAMAGAHYEKTTEDKKSTTKTGKKRKSSKKVTVVDDTEDDLPVLETKMSFSELEAEDIESHINLTNTSSLHKATPEYTRPLRSVSIHNDFGQIRLSVEEILECDISIMLIFKEDKDLIFIPKASQTLNLSLDDGRELSVYYPNTLFDNYFLAPGRKFMVLFKQSDE